jgi:hypothetical protein
VLGRHVRKGIALSRAWIAVSTLGESACVDMQEMLVMRQSRVRSRGNATHRGGSLGLGSCELSAACRRWRRGLEGKGLDLTAFLAFALFGGGGVGTARLGLLLRSLFLVLGIAAALFGFDLLAVFVE